ncbi:MAG: 16S rRNA (guanine(966)-N(2))-methyltransferase RsmD [Thermodesulfovibrionales bacterium]|nr:16S rRNA (guanine(966)-N(2))-methyltransferase RsmD [Thermodesulfovibrionales bacterium]
MKIIGGAQKGRLIKIKKSKFNKNLRPTSNKVRKAIFDILQDRIKGRKFLDLFAGTGAVGFEALSRGANKVTMVESNKELIHFMRDTAISLKCINDVIIIHDDVKRFLKVTDNVYDIIFVDQPYESDDYEFIKKIIMERDILFDNGILIFEHSSRKDISNIYSNLQYIKTYKYGDSALSIFMKGYQIKGKEDEDCNISGDI